MSTLQKGNRRWFMQAFGGASLLLVFPGLVAAGAPQPLSYTGSRNPGDGNKNNRTIRFGMTPAFLHDQHQLLDRWRLYMEQKLQRPVKFIVRDSYRETMDLLRLGQLDFGWICDYPYLYLQPILDLVAVPLYLGKPAYRSYLIVNARDYKTQSMRDLKDQIFAYADPYSNTGYLAPRYQIKQLGEDPAHFFRKTFFTWSHKKVVEAVASGLARGGAVDSFVWETLSQVEPELTEKTRIIHRSEEYGAPPLIGVKDQVDPETFESVQKMLLQMGDDPAGRELLKGLKLDGFSVQEPSLYESVARMMRAFGEYPAQ